jgi:type VII secretion-associated serine protease mycosin
MRKLLHTLTNQATTSDPPDPTTARRRFARPWRLLPVLLAFALALTFLAQVDRPTASAQTPDRPSPPPGTSVGSDSVVPGQYAVKLRRPVDAAAGASLAQSMGLRVVQEIPQIGWVIMDTPPGAQARQAGAVTAQLAASPGVLAVESVYEQSLMEISLPQGKTSLDSDPGALASNDPLIWRQWGHFSVNATDAWETTRASGITVAVIDSGVDPTHEDLVGRVLAGYDFWSDDADPDDENGHGTHVAGTIAAARNNSVGGTGIAPEANILPVRVLGPLGQGTSSLTAAGIAWAVDNGADVINLSLRGFTPTQVQLDAVNYALANDVLVVAATGNDSLNSPVYPAAYPGVIGVGALTPGRNVPAFSNTGSMVDVVAPGVAIWSSIPSAFNGGVPYVAWDGTSMASPHVAGIAALVRAANPGFTQAQVAARITSTAIDYGAAGYDTSFGWGAVDAYRALTNGSNPTSDYFEIEIEHPFIGDLFVGVGHSESAVQALFVPELDEFWYANIHVRYSLPESALAVVPGTWVLGASDEFGGFSGSLVGFRVRSGDFVRSYAGDPKPIEDGSGVLQTIEIPIPEGDSSLSALTISEGTLDPTFDPSTTAYTATVANTVESIDVTATTNDVDATLDIDGPATSGVPVNVLLDVGENPIDVVVTAEDTFNDTTYTVTVTREQPVTDPDLSTVVAADPSVEANGVASTTVTVTLLDVLSNPLIGHDVTLGQDGSSTISGGGLGTTDGAGQVTFDVMNITVETVTYDATDTTDGVAVVDTAEVEFTPIVADPDESTVDATDPSVAANGVASTTVTVTLLDSLGDPVPGHDVALTQDGGSSTILDGGLGTTDGSGQVSFTVTNTTPELVTYNAEDTTDSILVIDTAEVDFTDPVTDAGTSTVAAADPTVVADDTDSTTITVTLLDADDQPLEAHNVTLTQAGGSSTISDGGLGTTDASGQVSFTVTSTTVELVTYTATDTTDGVPVTGTAQVDFTPLPSDAAESTVEVTGDTAIPADGATTTIITVTLLNELAEPIVGHTVTLDQAGGSSIITGGALTDGAGQTVFTVSNTVQETVTYTATDDTDGVTVTQTAQVEFTEVPSDADQSTVSATPATVLANGVSTSTVTVTLRNAAGIPVGGHTVTLAQGGGSASISDGGTLVTDGSGQAEFTVTNTTVELVTFDAEDTTNGGPVTQTAAVDFITPTTDAGQSTVTAADPVVEADGTAATIVTVTLLDADGAPLATHDVTLTQGPGSSTISDGGIGTTNGAGQATFTVSNATVENVFYSATDDTDSVAVSQTAKVRFLIADQDASLSDLTLSEGSPSPAFDPDTLAYSASLPNGTEAVDVTPMTTQPGATLTIDGDPATSGVAVPVALDVGSNPVELVVTAPDGETTATYTLTINRASPPAPPIFFPPPPPPQLRVDLTVTNDDGGDAAPEDFTILVDDIIELTNGEPALLTFGGHLVSIDGPTALYSVEFGFACFEDGTVILLGGLSICSVHLDDQPLSQVLSQALPGAETLIDETLSLIDDAFERDGVNYVEASSPGSPPQITVALPVDAVPGIIGPITILVSPANELAIALNPPPGSLLVGGTGYVVQIFDGNGDPITNFALPLEISFLLPAGTSPLEAYYFDVESGLWVLQPGGASDGRFQIAPTHLTTFALFEVAPDGGLNGTPPSRGTWFTTAQGGSVTQLRRALIEAGATGAFITYQGQWVSYLPGAPSFVNQQFSDFFAAGIPQGHVFLITLGD